MPKNVSSNQKIGMLSQNQSVSSIKKSPMKHEPIMSSEEEFVIVMEQSEKSASTKDGHGENVAPRKYAVMKDA